MPRKNLHQNRLVAGPFVPFTVRRACAKDADMMSTACPDRSLSLRFETAAPVRSPRTTLILAALARQRRLERSKRRLKRQRRRQAWAQVRAGLDALSQWPFETIRRCAAPGLRFPEAVPLVYALRPL
jgi:hypothetical protein